jgi:hypothetical protein
MNFHELKIDLPVAGYMAAIVLCTAATLVHGQTNLPPAVPDAAATAVPTARLDYAPGATPKFWSVAAAETVMARWPDFTKAYFNAWT